MAVVITGDSLLGNLSSSNQRAYYYDLTTPIQCAVTVAAMAAEASWLSNKVTTMQGTTGEYVLPPTLREDEKDKILAHQQASRSHHKPATSHQQLYAHIRMSEKRVREAKFQNPASLRLLKMETSQSRLPPSLLSLNGKADSVPVCASTFIRL